MGDENIRLSKASIDRRIRRPRTFSFHQRSDRRGSDPRPAEADGTDTF